MDTKIISSQRYLNDEIVEEKKLELMKSEIDSVDVPIYEVGVIDEIEYYMIADKHHTRAAALELGLKINYVVIPDSEGLSGNALLEARWIDSPYYDIETGWDEW